MAQLRELWMSCWQITGKLFKSRQLWRLGDSLESCKIIRSNSKESLKRQFRNLSCFVSHTHNVHIYIYTILSTSMRTNPIRRIVVHVDVSIRFRRWEFITRSHQTGSSKGRCTGVVIYTVGISIGGIGITERIFDENGCGIALMNPQHQRDPWNFRLKDHCSKCYVLL